MVGEHAIHPPIASLQGSEAIAAEAAKAALSHDIEALNFLQRSGQALMGSASSASSVIFGALLSAYAGVKIASLAENATNAALLLLISVMHAAFLYALNVIHIDMFGDKPTVKLPWMLSCASCVVIASVSWHALFGSSLFYSAIIGGWIVMTIGVHAIIKLASSKYHALATHHRTVSVPADHEERPL
ncbi:MAG: hypothetical protein KGM17_03340 [Sphingomonadales bacterium]|nr:hypothetical protein [Sphingomonadales bacterium]